MRCRRAPPMAGDGCSQAATRSSSTISERSAISALARSISISSARARKRSSPQCAPSANGCWRGSDRKVTGPIERHTLQPIPTFRRSGCAHSARVSAVLADAGAVAQGPEYRRHGFPHWAAGRTVGAARRHDAYAGADLLILLPSALAARARTEHPWFRRHRTHSATPVGDGRYGDRCEFGIAQDGYRRSFAALKSGGLLGAYGYLGRRPGATPNGDHVDVDRTPLSLEVVTRRQACLLLFDQPDEGATSRLVPEGPRAALWNCWQAAPSGRALPIRSPSTGSPRHTAASRREVSTASLSCARTCPYRRAIAITRVAGVSCL